MHRTFYFQIKSRTRIFKIIDKFANLLISANNTINSLYRYRIIVFTSRYTEQPIDRIHVVAAELRPTSKSANSARLRESFACLEFRHDGIEGMRIPGVRANVKTHLVHPHERASGHVLARTYALAFAHTRPGFLWSDQ